MNSTASAIADWLLSSSVIIREGPHRGAVAGWLDDYGRASFAYPEITGYFLSWLCLLSKTGKSSEGISRSCSDAVQWFRRICGGEVPLQTRYHDDPVLHEQDWRNAALFTFDLTIAARGLSDAQRLIDDGLVAAPLQHLLAKLASGCNPGQALPAYVEARGALPTRWSTQPGPYQLKTAAALLFGVGGTPRLVREAAWNTYDRWRTAAIKLDGLNDLHPALYALEGLVEFGRHVDPENLITATHRLEGVLSKLQRIEGDGRSDVVAQTLRLSSSLGWDTTHTAGLHRYLHRFIHRGRVSFRPTGMSPVHWNSWAAMFSHEALLNCERFAMEVSA